MVARSLFLNQFGYLLVCPLRSWTCRRANETSRFWLGALRVSSLSAHSWKRTWVCSDWRLVA